MSRIGAIFSALGLLCLMWLFISFFVAIFGMNEPFSWALKRGAIVLIVVIFLTFIHEKLSTKETNREIKKEVRNERQKKIISYLSPRTAIIKRHLKVSTINETIKNHKEIYKDYLSSEGWKSLRLQAIERANYECELCREPFTEVHHVKYPKNGFNNDHMDNLVVVCRKCHSRLHGIRQE